MSQVVLKFRRNKQATALLAYLRTLDFVEVVEPPAPISRKEAAAGMADFLHSLPQVPHTQQEVNQALKNARKKAPARRS